MTAQEMINAFLLQYDLNGSGAVAGFTDEEILDFLNKAQLELVKDGVTKQGPELFEVLIDNQIYSLVSIVDDFEFPNSWKAQFDPVGSNISTDFTSKPDDYLFFISGRVLFDRSAYPVVTQAWAKTMEVKRQNLDKYLESGGNKTMFWNPVLIIASNGVTVITDSYTIIEAATIVANEAGTGLTTCQMVYVREPLSIRLLPTPRDSELNTRWHQNIIDNAVTNALLVTNDVRIRNKSSN